MHNASLAEPVLCQILVQQLTRPVPVPRHSLLYHTCIQNGVAMSPVNGLGMDALVHAWLQCSC